MTNTEQQAREFVLKADGWLLSADNINWIKHGEVATESPLITRAMIRELLEEEKDGERVREWASFYKELAIVVGTDMHHLSWVMLFIFTTLEDLIMAFWLTYREG